MKNIYLHSIYKVQDYIENHLYETLSLEKLASISGFSKFHFHRIFKSVVNEPLLKYINRLRLEKSNFFLCNNLHRNITDVAYRCGFSDSSTFSRAYKNYYNISPNSYRNNYSKNRKDPYKISQYNKDISKTKCRKSKSIKGNITIVDLKEINAFYVRHIGSYKNLENEFPKLLQKLYTYSKNKLECEVLVIYHDHPEFTNKDKLKTSICLPISNKIIIKNTTNTMSIPKGKYVVGHFEIYQNEFSDAWDFIYEKWLLNSTYKPRDSFPFEVYFNNPNTHPLKKHIVNIYLPIEPF